MLHKTYVLLESLLNRDSSLKYFFIFDILFFVFFNDFTFAFISDTRFDVSKAFRERLSQRNEANKKKFRNAIILSSPLLPRSPRMATGISK